MSTDQLGGRGAHRNKRGTGKGQRRDESKTLFLMENGYLEPATSQSMYEFALSHGIRQIDELALKPAALQLRRKKTCLDSGAEGWADLGHTPEVGQGA
jgi:hypothetical protein